MQKEGRIREESCFQFVFPESKMFLWSVGYYRKVLGLHLCEKLSECFLYEFCHFLAWNTWKKCQPTGYRG